jgi:hypothetical protein
MNNVFARVFASAAIRIGLFYALFKISVYLLSDFYYWERSIQRGILWWMYFVLFSVVVIIIDLVIFLSKSNNVKHRVLAGSIGILALGVYFIKTLKYAPYSILLPHVISLCILVLLPVLFEIFRQKGVKILSI